MTSKGSDFTAFNPYVSRLPTYNAGMAVERARQISGKQDIARLASNENPYGCSPLVKEALSSAAFEPWRYADPQCTVLRQTIAERLGVSPEQIVAGNGSEEMIAAISRAVLVPGDVAVTVVPSFGLHEIEPLAVGAKVIKVPLTPNLQFDLERLCEEIAKGPRLVFISSPSNPVGCILTQADLDRMVAGMLPGTVLVLDEAYVEYAASEMPDSIALLKSEKVPLIVLRTFSKAYGLAGLRVGYAVTSSPEMSRVMSAAKTPFNVNAAAQAAALAVLKDDAWMQAVVSRTLVERDRIAAALRDLGFRHSDSKSNSLFFDTGLDSTFVAEFLVKQGVIVKPWRESGYEKFIRISAGTPAENDRFIDNLSALMEAHRPQPGIKQAAIG